MLGGKLEKGVRRKGSWKNDALEGVTVYKLAKLNQPRAAEKATPSLTKYRSLA
jgi:hypothetical protein